MCRQDYILKNIYESMSIQDFTAENIKISYEEKYIELVQPIGLACLYKLYAHLIKGLSISIEKFNFLDHE